ncbi:MAG: PPC domain-containing protein, partial [Anaerolinea sp.]|nr:PPC domain-containing protein [Anaerolinea sp.]
SDRYFLIVGRFGYGVGTTGGSYTLSLERRGASSLSGSALRYGDSVINAISDDAPQVYYTFRGEPGDVVTVRMQRMSGDLDPALLIADSAGVIVAENDDMLNPANPGTLDAQIAGLMLPEGGIYVIIATRFGGEMGTSQGTFVLTLERGTGVTLGRTALTPIPIELGQTMQGEITSSRFEVWYRFEGRAGQAVTIRAARASGDLDPLIQLLDSGQAVLSENDDSDGTQNARIAGFVLPADGPYLILVTRYQRAAGRTTGAFTLSLER